MEWKELIDYWVPGGLTFVFLIRGRLGFLKPSAWYMTSPIC